MIVSDDKTMDHIEEKGGAHYVKGKEVVAEIVGKPYHATSTTKPKDESAGFDACRIPPNELVSGAVLKCFKEENLGRANGFKVLLIKERMISEGVAAINDYVLVGVEYEIDLQFCRYHPVRNVG